MRILEKNVGYKDIDTSVGLELLLDKVANSVFSMKHAGKSLEAECREAICCANYGMMLELGFDPDASRILVDVVTKLASDFGFSKEDLINHFKYAEENGGSSIINIIVRRQHKVWYTSRSNLHPVSLLKNLNTKPNDLASWMLHSARKEWEKSNDKNTSIKKFAA